MLHIVKMIQRLTPEHAGSIITAVAVVSGSALLVGVALLLLR